MTTTPARGHDFPRKGVQAGGNLIWLSQQRRNEDTMTLFITGERSTGMGYLPFVAVEMLRALAAGEQVVTGQEDGVEECVRYLSAETGVPVAIMPETPRDANGKRDYAERIAALPADVRFLFVGNAAISSNWAALAALPDERASLALV